MSLLAFGCVYSWGNNDNGQIGHSEEIIPLPKVVEAALGTVVGQIAAGEQHTLAMTCISNLQKTHKPLLFVSVELVRYEFETLQVLLVELE